MPAWRHQCRRSTDGTEIITKICSACELEVGCISCGCINDYARYSSVYAVKSCVGKIINLISLMLGCKHIHGDLLQATLDAAFRPWCVFTFRSYVVVTKCHACSGSVVDCAASCETLQADRLNSSWLRLLIEALRSASGLGIRAHEAAC